MDQVKNIFGNLNKQVADSIPSGAQAGPNPSAHSKDGMVTDMSPYEKIDELYKLMQKGAITESEFNQKKQEILQQT